MVESYNEDKYVIDNFSVIRDTYSEYRKDLSLKNSKKREFTKKKEKTAVNKEISALQKAIKENENNELDEYWLY